MKRWIVTSIICVVALWAGPVGALTSSIAALERGPLPQAGPPEVRVVVLPNGMRCFLLPEHTLPVVKVSLIVRAGGIYDPPEKVGLAALTGALLRSGGAAGYAPEAFDTAADGLGARLAAEMGSEMGSLTLEVLSEDVEAGLKLLFDMAFEPRFDAKRLDVARQTLLEALRREDDDPDDLVAYKFAQFVYGEGSPWARRPTPDSLARVTREDVRALHERYFKANNILLAAAGDFDAEAFAALLRKLTDGAAQGKVDFPAVPAVALAYEPGKERITRPTTQSFIRMGHLSVKRDNPDKYPLILLDEVLGGGFKSRLMEDIRTQRGLAYSVWSSITPGTDYGLFTVGVNTKAEQETAAMELVQRHIERLEKRGDVTPSELTFAKQSILSRFVFEFDRAFKVVQGRARFFFYGYPDDYWRVYRDHIIAAGAEDMKRVGARYLHAEGLKAVVVGPEAAASKPGTAGKPETAARPE